MEDPLFFGDAQYPLHFHKQKLILHRASMKEYELELIAAGYMVQYKEYGECFNTEKSYSYLAVKGEASEVAYFDTVDYALEKRLANAYKKEGLSTPLRLPSPSFFLTDDEVRDILGKAPHKMTPFYRKLRLKYSILLEDGKPLGGSWTYDTENRKKLPRGMEVKEALKEYKSESMQEAQEYVARHFKNSYGQGDSFYYGATRADAEKVLEIFLTARLENFGPYEDAMATGKYVLFHSTLSIYLNIGLLTPQDVIEKALARFEKGGISLESIEGFVRQILGWREFIRGVYVISGVKQRTHNFFKHTKKLDPSWWTGTTGVLPIDDVIQKVLSTGYAHHIERLMVLGNYQLLTETDPDESYKWFMELFIDAYDWVMVPNVYGMISYADGGLMTTKPYISGANYILKMSDYKKGEWAAVWTELYWKFIEKHKELFLKNPRMRMILSKRKEEGPQ